MRISGSIDILELEVEQYTKSVRKAVEVHTRNAVRKFMRAAIPRIPVDTGMARGSFLNLGRFLRVEVPINPVSFDKKYYYKPAYGSPKNKETGASISTDPEDAFYWKGGKFWFAFNSQVFHLKLEDEIGVHSGPWNSFRAGRIAYLIEMRKIKQRLPNIKGFFIKTTVSWGKNAGLKRKRLQSRKQITLR